MVLLTLCSYWIEASLEEQLQFLSYLFQNALPQSIPKPPSAHNSFPTLGQLGTNHIASGSLRQSHPIPNLNPDEPLLNGGKGGRWETEELDLIRELREKHKLPWSKIAKAFDEKWLGRSRASIQVEYSTSSGRQKRARIA